MTMVPWLPLNDGYKIPQFGLGVWQVPMDRIGEVIRTALDENYRHIDTAAAYKNEAGVGDAIAHSGLPRDRLFITTKLWNAHHGRDSTLKAFDDSMAKLKLDYLDLYLIHWPLPYKDLFVETWRALIELQRSGRVRSIGVSNFRVQDLQRIIDDSGVTPAVNQIELHPLLQQRELRDFHHRHGIMTEAWSPLARGNELLQHPDLQSIADKYGKTVAQIVLRWHVQHGWVVFPKSVTPSRIIENIQVFDFVMDHDDLAVIDALDAGQRIGPHPDTFAME